MLDKRSKKIVYLCGIFILVLIITEVIRPKPIDWTPNYTIESKKPLGGYIFYEELEHLLKPDSIIKVQLDPFEYLMLDSTTVNATYIFVNDFITLDEQQTNKLLDFAHRGNTVFLSGHSFGYAISDTLNVAAYSEFGATLDPIIPQFFDKRLSQDSLPIFEKAVRKATFDLIDTLHTTAIGHFNLETPSEGIDEFFEDDATLIEDTEGYTMLDELNYIKLPVGEGQLLFHTLPEAFSNYYMLDGAEQYAANVLSHITHTETILYDTHIKSGKKFVDSNMRFIFSQAPLTWAYYLLMGGIILFVIFKGKREQRIIEVLEPLENTSIEFTKTIGDLYFQHKDFGNLIAKKITFFLDHVRTAYFLDTNELNQDFIKKLGLKSGNSLDDTQKLIAKIKELKSKTFHTEADLIEINTLIDTYRS